MYLDDSFEKIRAFDPEMARLTLEEEERQLGTLSLVASENYASPLAVGLEGSVWADKNAEGYPRHRSVAGCELADRVEELCQRRMCELFGAEHANVQCMSVSIANVCVQRALLEPGDTILSMDMAQGGHYTHGAPCHYSGETYRAVFYGVDGETETIDMDEVERLARACRPKLVMCGCTFYPRGLDYERFARIAHDVGAYCMADLAHPVGLIVSGVLPSPFPHVDVATSSTHKTWRGSRGGGVILCREALAERIDASVFPGMQGAPKMDMIAARAVQAKESTSPQFRAYGRKVRDNALALADELARGGLRLVTGGTDTHLILADVRGLAATGAEAEATLEGVGLIVNRNEIPFDPQRDAGTSGVRIGTAALTTRGLEEDEMREVGRLLVEALAARGDEARLKEVRARVSAIARAHPLFDEEKWLAR